MSRLTQKDDSGNWSLKGLPWKDTYVGQVITRNTEEKIYGALCKLRDYEESGLDPEQVQQLKERDTAKRPIKNGAKFTQIYECPVCGCKDVSWQSFCDECGQRLDWSDEDEKI